MNVDDDATQQLLNDSGDVFLGECSIFSLNLRVLELGSAPNLETLTPS